MQKKFLKGLENLWSRAIKAKWKRCLLTGKQEGLQAHHVRGRDSLLAFDHRNGIPLYGGLWRFFVDGRSQTMTPHDLIHEYPELGKQLIITVIGLEAYEELEELERMDYKQYLFDNELSEDQYLEKMRTELKGFLS